MSNPRFTSAIAEAAAAHRQMMLAKEQQTKAAQRRSAEEQSLRKDEAKLALLKELEAADEALRHLDGEDAVPIDQQRAEALQGLNDDIPRRIAAIPILKQREAQKEREAAATHAPYSAAIVAVVTAIQDPVVEQIKAELAKLAKPLRDLLAADKIRTSTIGDRFAVPEGQSAPFHGGVLVDKFVRAIPQQLFPNELSGERLETAALSLADNTIRLFKDARS